MLRLRELTAEERGESERLTNLRSLALKGRRFASWDEVCAAVREATASWNAHRHPFV